MILIFISYAKNTYSPSVNGAYLIATDGYHDNCLPYAKSTLELIEKNGGTSHHRFPVASRKYRDGIFSTLFFLSGTTLERSVFYEHRALRGG